jgi:transcriptional regulator with XRE-family HTH domain
MTRAQLRAARALLSWSQERLAHESGISLATIKRLEPGDGLLATKLETADKLRRTLEAAGIEFMNGGQPGVRLRMQPASQAAGNVVHGVEWAARMAIKREVRPQGAVADREAAAERRSATAKASGAERAKPEATNKTARLRKLAPAKEKAKRRDAPKIKPGNENGSH